MMGLAEENTGAPICEAAKINRLEAGPERVTPFRPSSLVGVGTVAIVLMSVAVAVGLARSTTWGVCHLRGLKRLLLS